MCNTRKKEQTRIRVGQINLTRSQLATDEIHQYVILNQIDVLLVQEPHTHQGRVAGFGPGVRIAQATKSVPLAAVVVYRDDWTVIKLGHITTALLAATHVWTGRIGVNLASLYCPKKRRQPKNQSRPLRELGTALRSTSADGWIIGADSNSRSTWWYSGSTDKRVTNFEEFISRTGLQVINKWQSHSTFQSTRGCSNIDVTLARGCANVIP